MYKQKLQIFIVLITAIQIVVFFAIQNLKHSSASVDSSNPTKHLTSSLDKTEPAINSLVEDRKGGLLLIIGIITYYKRPDRRDAIRQTWMSQAKNRRDVLTRFYTDSSSYLDQESKESLAKENGTHGDLIYMPHPPGINFGVRLIWILQQVHQQHNFRYFLRLDDDHFLCLERLLHELPSRPSSALYWGFVHCHPRVIRVDEAWMLFSFDLVDEFVQHSNTSLLCNPFGDQSVALWVQNSNKTITYFMDNSRIIHKSSARDPRFLKPNVCERFISLHGSYPGTMRKYWVLTQNFRKRWKNPEFYKIDPIPDFSKKCRVKKKFDWQGFIDKYRFEPKLCASNPTWEITQENAETREEGESYTNY